VPLSKAGFLCSIERLFVRLIDVLASAPVFGDICAATHPALQQSDAKIECHNTPVLEISMDAI